MTEYFLVGRRLPNGSLEFYSVEHVVKKMMHVDRNDPRGLVLGATPIDYQSADVALKEAIKLDQEDGNDDFNALILGSEYVPTQGWEVYRILE